VEDGDGVVGSLEAAGDLVGAVLGAGEHEHAVKVGLLQEREEEVELLGVADGIEGVLDGLVDGAAMPTSMRVGLRRAKEAMAEISGGTVAEKSRV
jgi:hypothetical protein